MNKQVPQCLKRGYKYQAKQLNGDIKAEDIMSIPTSFAYNMVASPVAEESLIEG